MGTRLKAEVWTATGSTRNSTLSQNEAKLFVSENEPAILPKVKELNKNRTRGHFYVWLTPLYKARLSAK